MRRWLALGSLFFCGCACTPESLQAPYVHVSLFTLNPGASDRAVEKLLADAEQLLTQIPAVRGLWVGRPVPQPATEGMTIDGSYDMGMLLIFRSKTGLDEFRQDPGYLEFRGKHQGSVEVRTIDFSPFGGAPTF